MWYFPLIPKYTPAHGNTWEVLKAVVSGGKKYEAIVFFPFWLSNFIISRVKLIFKKKKKFF